METKNSITIQLTETDKLILASLNNILDGLSDYLGDSFEFVIHSLENLDSSVIKIINGEHTGRSVGSPITNLALTMLARIENDNTQDFITYFSKNRLGEPLKATTIAVRGENNRIIGLICINCYLNTPLLSVIKSFMEPKTSQTEPYEEEFLSDNIKSTVEKALEIARNKIEADSTIPISLKKKMIISQLYTQGIFEVKDAVNIVAANLGISPNTVYLHLRAAKKTSQ